MASAANDTSIGANFAEIAGTRVEIVEKGSGPALLLLHGLDGIEEASGLIDALAGKFSVIAPSHPGFGESDRPKSYDEIDDLAYFYLDLIEERGLTDLTVVGLSFGGWVAAETLIKSCHGVSRLILVNPLGLKTGARKRKHGDDLFMLFGRELDAALGLPPSPPPREMDPAVLTRVMRGREATSLYGWSPALNDPRLARRLHRIGVPTLIVAGTEDRLSGQGVAQAYAEAIPGARLETVAGGHRLDQDTLAARIAAFAGE